MASRKEMQLRKAMRIVRSTEGWMFHDPFNPECSQCGPYKTKSDCEEDRNGLARTYARESWLIED